MKNIYEIINSEYKNLSISEQQVIDFVLKYKDSENLKLKYIMENLHVSTSTIIRACKKLGFSSFNMMKFSLIAAKDEEMNMTKEDFKVIKETITNDFTKTFNLLSEELVNQFVNLILNSKRIFCVGLGNSSMVVNEFNRQLKLLGLWSNNFNERYEIERIADIALEDDLIIVISLSGEDSKINELVLNLKSKRIKIASITNLGNNSLSKLSDVPIFVYNSKFNRSKIRSRLMLHVATTLIFEELLNKKYQLK